jgi:hypothetical protein
VRKVVSFKKKKTWKGFYAQRRCNFSRNEPGTVNETLDSLKWIKGQKSNIFDVNFLRGQIFENQLGIQILKNANTVACMETF